MEDFVLIMSCSLQISTENSKYRAGDTVSGSVNLVSQDPKGQEVDVSSITLRFTGKSTAAKIWPRIPYSITLFSFQRALFTGPKRLYAPCKLMGDTDRSSWSFAFTLPLDCSAFQRDSLPSSPPFNSDPNQPLPISFKDDNVQDGSCSIVYELQATLHPSSKDGYYTSGGSIEKVEIHVYRPRNIQQPNFIFNTKSATFAHRSLLLLPREERKLVHRPLTIKEKLKLKTPSIEHLPKAVFDIRVQTPSAAAIGQPLPLILHVGYSLEASTVPPPIFHLKRITIHLCEETSIWGLKNAGEHESTRWTKEIMLQEKEFETPRPQVEGHLDIRRVMDTIVDRDLSPTFRTFNIARTYSLKVFVRLECAGKDHLVFGDYKRCTLFAEEYDARAAAYHEPALILDDDPPPPYHFVTQEAVPEYSIQARHLANHGENRAVPSGTQVLDAAESSATAASDSTATGFSAATTLLE